MLLKKLKRNKDHTLIENVIRFGLIPFSLIVLWAVLSILHISTSPGITILVYPHSQAETVRWQSQELVKGQKLIGKFTARDNNLGIVAVRFNTFFRINNDTVLFRIKEQNQNDWFYTYEYTTPQFQPNQLFTFGFPIIENSQGKTFIFEVVSRNGSSGNAVAASSIEPVYTTKYQYSRQRITSDSNYAVKFISRKIANTLTDVNFLLSSIIYFLPFVMYFIWLFFFEKYFAKRYYLAFVPIILMLLTVLAHLQTNNVVVLGFTLLWAYFVYLYRFSSTISLVIAIIFISISAMVFYSGITEAARGLSMWGFLVFSVGVLQQLLELRYPRKGIGIKELRTKLRKNSHS